MKKISIKLILILLCIIAIIGMVNVSVATDTQEYMDEAIINENDIAEVQLMPINNMDLVRAKAKVIMAGEIYDDTSSGFVTKIQEVRVRVIEGEYKDRIFGANYVLSYDIDNKILCYPLDKHNTVFVQINREDGNVTKVLVEDVVRESYIYTMIAVFFLLILVIGGRQGLKAIASLLVTIAMIAFVTIMSIYKGYNPVLMSVATCVISIVVNFIIIAGINKKSLTAMIGTSGGVISAGLIAILFGSLAKLSGGGEEAVMLSINATHINFNFRELLFAGIVISALGACMDVGMSIASALDEIKQNNPKMGWKELFRSGMNIGKDVMATMTNTLILAYVGGSLTLILLFMSADFGIMDMINKETIASEIIGALAGSTGVICTIPITAIIYAMFFRKANNIENKDKDDKNGKRELKI